MSDNNDDVLFRIGFESHPQAGAKLEALAQAVELTQKRIDHMFTTTAARVASAATAMQASMSGTGTQGTQGVGSQGGASQLEAMANARRATQQRVVVETRAFNSQMEMAAGHEVLTLEKRNEGLQLFVRARAAILRGEAELARRQLVDDRESSAFAIEQLKKDLQLIEDVQSGEGGSAIGATNEQVTEAAERVKKYYDTIKQGQDQVAQDERKLAEQQVKESKRVQAEQDRAHRNRRRLIENTRRLEEQAERDAQRARDKAAREDAKLERTVRRARKLWVQEQRALADEAARPWLEAYERETQAAARSTREIQQGRRMIFQSMSQTAMGMGKLARSTVLLGLANGEQMEKVIRQLALVQAGIDLVSGAARIVRGVSSAFEGLRLVILGRIAATRAATAADALAVQGSVAVQNALNLEALSAGRAAAAHTMLARARAGGQPMTTPIVPPGRGGSRGMIAGTAGGVGGAIVGGAAGAAAGSKVGGESGQAIGGTAGAVVGSVAGAVMLQQLMQHGPKIGQAMGRGLMMLAAAPLAKVALAVGGAAFIARQTYTLASDVKRHGVGGGSEVGSFNDRVGGSNWNPASWLMAADLKFQAMADAEKTRRMENASVLLRQEQQHLRDLDQLRMASELKRQSITREADEAIFRGRFDLLRTPEEKLGKIDARSGEMVGQRDAAALRLSQAQEREEATRFEVQRRMAGNGPNDGKDPATMMSEAQAATQQALEAHDAAVNRVISSEQERLQLTRQIAAENRRATLDQIKGIEDTIRARVKEIEQRENMMKSARARFGQLTKMEQEGAKDAFRRIKDGGAANADPRDIDAIRKVGTDETRRMVDEFEQSEGMKSGFNQVFSGESDRLDDAANKELREQAMKAAEITGQDADKILENARKPIQVDLVNTQELNVKLNTQEDDLFNALMEKIEGLIEQQKEDRLKRLENDDRVSQVTEQAGVRREAMSES